MKRDSLHPRERERDDKKRTGKENAAWRWKDERLEEREVLSRDLLLQ